MRDFVTGHAGGVSYQDLYAINQAKDSPNHDK